MTYLSGVMCVSRTLNADLCTNLPHITVRPFRLPIKVWGKELGHAADWSDILRIKTLYN